MVEEHRYLISDAAKMVAVEAHVLRYWEEELELSIGRTELGHRYYTRENIETFRNVKELKEKGLQLKAIKTLLQGLQQKGEEIPVPGEKMDEEPPKEPEKATREAEGQDEPGEAVDVTALAVMERNASKLNQFETLVADIVDRVVKENNEELRSRLEASFSKEMDYMIHMQEAREEERFRKLDAVIRAHQKGGRMAAATKEKSFFGRWFKK